MDGRIAYFQPDGKVGIVTRELPRPEAGAMLVRVLSTNVCGSDVKNWKGGGPVGVGGNSCQGHEFIGRVERLGEGVKTDYAGQNVQVGDRVVAAYFITCEQCAACRQGRYDQCENAYLHLGKSPEEFPYFSGTFATHYYIHPRQHFFKVPDTLPDDLAAGANCAFSQVYYGLERAQLTAGETLLVQGAGGLGLYAAAIAKEKGARVIAIDGVAERLELAKRFGVDDVINMADYPELEDRELAVRELTDDNGPQVALEVTGIAGAFEEGIRHLAVMGRYLVVGINSFAVSAVISPGYITRKSLTVYGVVRYPPEYLHKSLQFLDACRSKYPFDEFSSTTFGLDELEEALRQSADRAVTRAVIRP